MNQSPYQANHYGNSNQYDNSAQAYLQNYNPNANNPYSGYTYPNSQQYSENQYNYNQQGYPAPGQNPVQPGYQQVQNNNDNAAYPVYDNIQVDEFQSSDRPVTLSPQVKNLLICLAITFLMISIYLIVVY